MQELEKILEEIKAHRNFASECGNFNVASAFELCVEIIRNHMNNGWIPVEERLPKEHDSIFAKWKGTDKWSKSMFEKTSGDVNVTVEYEDGERNTITAKTVDGKWLLPNRIIKQKVIAWQPLPEPYRR